jgi:ketol-acid reductoisomerase
VTDGRVLFERDLDVSPLRGKRIGIVGYGSQGRAQALNLRDGGFNPLVGVRPGSSFERARTDGFEPGCVDGVARESDLVVLVVPDEVQPDLCKQEIFPNCRQGVWVGFATGFNVHFGLIAPPPGVGFFLAAPKGAGAILRQRFEQGGGLPAVVGSLGDDPQGLALAKAYAAAIGCGRAGVVESTFREEAIADLFGEQCVLTGGLVELMKAAFDVLVERGYSAEVAYIECIQEVEYMAALISRVGLAALGERISSTAWYGGSTRGARLVDETVRRKMTGILDEIESGAFAREFLANVRDGHGSPAPTGDMTRLEQARARLGGI